MKLLTYDDLGDILLLLMSVTSAPAWLRPGSLRRGIGYLDFLLRRGRARSIRQALADAYGDGRHEGEIRALGRRVFASKWENRELYWYRRVASSGGGPALVSCEGIEHLRAALERGKGAIVWESPFGARALGRIALTAQGIPLTLVRGPDHGGGPSKVGQRWMKGFHREAERKLFFETLDIQTGSAEYLKKVMARLQQNGVVCVSSFGPMGRRFVVLPFLGVKQCFAVGVPNLAHVTGAPLIPANCVPLDDGRYQLVLEPPVPVSAEEGLEEMQVRALGHYAGLLEGYVNRYPDQWLRWGDRLMPGRPYFRDATLIESSDRQPGEERR